ncbi:MAG TPA: hypothetical protein VF476_07885, partial [Chitinophagaceae bacterium]
MFLKKIILFAAFFIPTLALQAQQYGNIEFIENKGQWNNRVKYQGEVSNGAVFIRNGGFTIVQHSQEDMAKVNAAMHGHDYGGTRYRFNEKIIIRSHAWNVDFVDASSAMRVVPDKIVSSYNNYFIGNDPSKWASDCKLYQAVTLENIYPNIDARYYTDNGTLKYDIIVKPGGDVSRIALKYDGVDKLQVKNKELLVATSLGELKESSPYTYQAGMKGKQEVNCKYIVKDNIVRFDVKDYDRNSTLVIDPTLIFCSFSRSTANNWGYTATYGPDGSMFGGGIVFALGFPVSTGAYQTVFQGGGNDPGTSGIDIGIIKLSPTGNNRIYATYIGGSDGNEQPHSLIVDPQGNLILAGRSSSANYPVTGGTPNLAGSLYDIVVTKLNSTGTGIIGSKKIGGSADDGVNITINRGSGANSLTRNYGDDGRSEVNIDAAGNIYVASCTQSLSGGRVFPTTAGVFQGSPGGGSGQDGVLLKFDASVTNLLFSSFIGGAANDAAYVLAIGPNGNIYVGGGTESSETSFLPGTHGGTVGPTYGGSIDGYLAEITSNGSSVVRSTFLGTSSIDQVYGVQFDRNGFPYVMGQSGAWQRFNIPATNDKVPPGAQFIAKLQPDFSAFVYSFTFGTGTIVPNISPIAFLVDRCENVYVSGWGGDILGN